MKFILSRDAFAQTVSWVARTLPARPPQPVLAGIKIDADPDAGLTFTSFDYETFAQANIDQDVEVTQGGSVLVSGRMLNDIANALPPGQVTVTLDESKVLIRCGTAKFTLFAMPLSEYPNIPEFPPAAGVFNGAQFAQAIKQVEVAASRDDTLPLLTSVKIVSNGQDVKLLSTDRYRLAKAELTWQPKGDDVNVLVRARALTGAARSIAATGQVTFAVSPDGSLIGIEADGRKITSLVNSGDYPDVERLFPTEAPLGAVVNLAALREAVKRVSLVAERNAPVRIGFNPDNTLTLSAGDNDQAAATEALEAEVTCDGETFVVAFNPTFLSDGLGALDTEFVRFEITHPTKPVLLTGVGEDNQTDETYRYLIVPVRVAR